MNTVSLNVDKPRFEFGQKNNKTVQKQADQKGTRTGDKTRAMVKQKFFFN